LERLLLVEGVEREPSYHALSYSSSPETDYVLFDTVLGVLGVLKVL